jgi:hypothetical protein
MEGMHERGSQSRAAPTEAALPHSRKTSRKERDREASWGAGWFMNGARELFGLAPLGLWGCVLRWLSIESQPALLLMRQLRGPAGRIF